MSLEEHRRGAIEVGMEGGKECNEKIVFGDAMSAEMARLEDAGGG